MNHIHTPRITYSLIFGTMFFAIGLIIDDLYVVIAGASLIIIWTIIETGEKIIRNSQRPPKPL